MEEIVMPGEFSRMY